MPRKFCGHTQEEVKNALYLLCDIEDEFDLSEEELDLFDVAIQCVSAVMNRMIDGCEDRPILWDDEDYQ